MTLTEQVFRKMGADIVHAPAGENIFRWEINGNSFTEKSFALKEYASDALPPISSSWEVCAKYLVPFMEEAGFSWVTRKTLGWAATGSKMKYFVWDNTEQNTILEFVIVKNDIAEAACKAFMEIKL